ncbi:MAG TPA: sulfotransferase [Flavobacteriales bacterium]|nr:sulfotransferase [Flavobacteriales bacterium]
MRPALIIIGAQKAGTTTLYHLLAQHPRIIQPRVKEVSFFCNEEAYARGMGHYRSFFPRRPVLGRAITFDASPMYLYHERCAERIARQLPEAICLAILRDPVERAYSAWNMYHQFKNDPRHAHLHDPRGFEEAVEEELSGRQVDSARRYLDRGVYMPQLARYLRAVGPDRLLVHGFDQVKQDPAGLVNGVLARLGLEALPADHPAFATRSNSRVYESAMSAPMTERLRAFFAEDMDQVHRAYGFRLSPPR